jgi:hypothetical protein
MVEDGNLSIKPYMIDGVQIVLQNAAGKTTGRENQADAPDQERV